MSLLAQSALGDALENGSLNKVQARAETRRQGRKMGNRKGSSSLYLVIVSPLGASQDTGGRPVRGHWIRTSHTIQGSRGSRGDAEARRWNRKGDAFNSCLRHVTHRLAGLARKRSLMLMSWEKGNYYRNRRYWSRRATHGRRATQSTCLSISLNSSFSRVRPTE